MLLFWETIFSCALPYCSELHYSMLYFTVVLMTVWDHTLTYFFYYLYTHTYIVYIYSCIVFFYIYIHIYISCPLLIGDFDVHRHCAYELRNLLLFLRWCRWRQMNTAWANDIMSSSCNCSRGPKQGERSWSSRLDNASADEKNVFPTREWRRALLT